MNQLLYPQDNDNSFLLNTGKNLAEECHYCRDSHTRSSAESAARGGNGPRLASLRPVYTGHVRLMTTTAAGSDMVSDPNPIPGLIEPTQLNTEKANRAQTSRQNMKTRMWHSLVQITAAR
jgi:hypothetical protein